ncbi:hypothetical protein [Ulvibacterium marinum]|uniref:Uncharacterized protein n=1 Tax=Ulvibacterium marinum TaxID=2419782 RepID=A0A3B0CD49_9FLAO|nr:hypothetical protein [Ulvibacterium marinum]RKN81807.1 hypothetical protein D7Z94_13045 [Ulvibacterium marinum]
MNRKAFLSLAGKGGLPRKRKVGKGRSKAPAEQIQSKWPATRTTPPPPSAPAPWPDHLPLPGEGPAKDRPTGLQGNLCSLELKYRMNRRAFLSLVGKGTKP